MKRSTKGILAFLFLGGIMVTSGVVIAIPGIAPQGGMSESDTAETYAANYPVEDRPRFCGTGSAGSTAYVQEYAIPTPCTNPLGITTDYKGNVWFAQTNTGKVAKFDPATGNFSEYDNPEWPPGARSMMWGMDYAPDGSVWFTDETHDSVWKFSTLNEAYQPIGYPAGNGSYPQRIQIDGSQIMINDFTGNHIFFLNPDPASPESYLSLPSPITNDTISAFTSDFAVDGDDNVWYTNWIFQQGGFLVKFDQQKYWDSVLDVSQQFYPLLDYIDLYGIPGTPTVNGVAVSDDGTVWMTDTTSSNFLSFDPVSLEFVTYVTADPLPSAYGNQTGVIRSPVSGPYWIIADQNRLIMNMQTANNIAVMNLDDQSLVEYHVPSKNPHWSDCDPGTGSMVADCGLAQVFDIAADGDRIWFTEWVENNIGVVDTSVPLPIDIRLDQDALELAPGESADVGFAIVPMQARAVGASVIALPAHDAINVELAPDSPETLQVGSEVRPVRTSISVDVDAEPGTYKVLLGAQLSDVAVSKFVTVTVR